MYICLCVCVFVGDLQLSFPILSTILSILQLVSCLYSAVGLMLHGDWSSSTPLPIVYWYCGYVILLSEISSIFKISPNS